MQTPTAEEQLMLELINQLRADPAGEVDRLIYDLENRLSSDGGVSNALRFFDVDMDLLVAQMDVFDPVAPLAWNADLAQSADTHSEGMIAFDSQSHHLPGEPGMVERLQAAGYDNLQTMGENIFAYADNAFYGHAGFVIDWGYGPGGIQDPAGHRNTLLSDRFTEIGLSMLEELDGSTQVGPYVVTQHLANRFDYQTQLVGVVIDDFDDDDFYDVGEGLAGISVVAVGSAGVFSTTTWASGGYQLELEPGQYEVTFSGGALDGTIIRTVTIGDDNVKLDAEADDAIGTSGDEDLLGTSGSDLLRGTGASEVLEGFGGSDTLEGGGGDDTLDGGAGADVLDGGAGIDTASYASATRSVRVDLQDDRFMFGDAVGDTFTDIEIFRTGGGVDQLRGDAGDNEFYGGGVSDRLYGRAGDDLLFGEAGADALYGGVGTDVMTGGDDAGRRDRYIYFNIVESGVGGGNRDIITDFVSGEDRIEISRFDADVTIGRNQAFDFIGQSAFSDTAGELRYFSGNGRTVVQADVDGDGAADFEIELTGQMTLSADDFLL